MSIFAKKSSKKQQISALLCYAYAGLALQDKQLYFKSQAQSDQALTLPETLQTSTSSQNQMKTEQ